MNENTFRLSDEDINIINQVYENIKYELDNLVQNLHSFVITKDEIDEVLGQEDVKGVCIKLDRHQPLEDPYFDQIIYHILPKFIFSQHEYEKKKEEFKNPEGKLKDVARDQLRINTTAPVVQQSDKKEKIISEEDKRKNKTILIRGQYGEMILFALLTYYFKAPPIVKLTRQNINDRFEVIGADALHISSNNDIPLLYIGESKCTENLKDGIKDGIKSVLKIYDDLINQNVLYTRYENHRSIEFDSLYEKFLKNDFSGDIETVNLIICSADDIDFKKDTEENYTQIKQWVIEAIKKSRPSDMDNKKYNIDKFHFIIFPIKEFNNHLEKTAKKLK